jgi:phage-related protein
METFTWTPDFGSPMQETPSVSIAKFGDGYEARQATGLNPNRQVHNLTFSNRDGTEKSAIVAFLRARAGVEAFKFTTPTESTELVFVCRTWQTTPIKSNLFSVQASFEQVYEPT